MLFNEISSSPVQATRYELYEFACMLSNEKYRRTSDAQTYHFRFPNFIIAIPT